MQMATLSNSDIQQLLGSASDAMRLSYSPYSGIKIGAAILTTTGNIYLGANVANSCSTLNCCAEQVAMNSAVMKEDYSFIAIAILESNGNSIFPCGRCLQLLSEFSNNMTVITRNKVKVFKSDLRTLLPRPYKRSERKLFLG